MTCEKSPYVVATLLDELSSSAEREQLRSHVSECAHCSVQLEEARVVQQKISTWQDAPVPHWVRSSMVKPKQESVQWWQRFSLWQWAPLACSFLLALGVIFNVEFHKSNDGFVVVFGASGGVTQQQVQEQISRLSAQLDAQREADSLRLVETVVGNVMRQYDENNSRNLEQVIEYFDLQRQQDLQLLQSGYQQLADSDYETIRSVQQLASYVQYQGLEP